MCFFRAKVLNHLVLEESAMAFLAPKRYLGGSNNLRRCFNRVFAQASQDAWIFAHRVNSVESVKAADDDSNINTVEIDLTLRSKVPTCPRLDSSLGDEIDNWCSFPDGEGVNNALFANSSAYFLADVLKRVRESDNLHAVWLDMKTIDASAQEARWLVNTVRAQRTCFANYRKCQPRYQDHDRSFRPSP